MIPYGKQEILDADVEAVVNALRSDLITQGGRVPAFEQALCDYTGANHCVVANSATSCLHIACLALGLGPGDTLWCPPITFVASTNCALYCGAEVDFVDVDPLTANIDPEALATKLANAAATGKLPKVLTVVHMAGSPCDMERIAALVAPYDIAIIEDASHAVGARYLDEPVGNCRFSAITVFSFHPVKIITTAEGGAAFTNDPDLAREMSLFRSHGITRDEEMMTGPSDGQWYYQQLRLGLNYRMTEIHAALGISQLDRLDAYVERRQQIAATYDAALADQPLTPVRPISNSTSAYHLYLVLLDDSVSLAQKSQVFDRMRDQGIGVNIHYIPVPSQPYYRTLGFDPDDYPGAQSYYRRTLSIPMYPTLQDDEQAMVINALGDALGNTTDCEKSQG